MTPVHIYQPFPFFPEPEPARENRLLRERLARLERALFGSVREVPMSAMPWPTISVPVPGIEERLYALERKCGGAADDDAREHAWLLETVTTLEARVRALETRPDPVVSEAHSARREDSSESLDRETFKRALVAKLKPRVGKSWELYSLSLAETADGKHYWEVELRSAEGTLRMVRTPYMAVGVEPCSHLAIDLIIAEL